MGRLLGVTLIWLAVMLFFAAVRTMRDSWRAGLPEQKTALITSGIYAISRNPAFLAFDLTYIGTVLLYFNFPLLLLSLVTIIAFHLQILQEEAYLTAVFRDVYAAYRSKVRRYI